VPQFIGLPEIVITQTDQLQLTRNVRFVPIADIGAYSITSSAIAAATWRTTATRGAICL